MVFFSHSISLLQNWITCHPQAAFFAILLVSFCESIVFLGTIIPGTVIMTAMGILAGRGIMRIDITLMASALGAFLGDGFNYTLGRIFSDKLANLWPFSSYPHWISYGKNYFKHHGGKSVLLGRFTGPLRPIFPTIAGMMKMNSGLYFTANIASAVGWAFLYVTPGVLIGKASHELSVQSASKLFVVILVLLAGIWVLTLAIKWLFVSIQKWLSHHFGHGWRCLLKYRFFQMVTPPGKESHEATAMICVILLIGCMLIPISLYLCQYSDWIQTINHAVNQFCLSIRTQDFDAFFVVMRVVLSELTLPPFLLVTLFCVAYQRDLRLFKFLLSLIFTTVLCIIALSYWMHALPAFNPPAFSVFLSYPTSSLIIASAFFGFIIFYLAHHTQQILCVVLKFFLLCVLLFSGLALIYFGEDWLSNVLLAYKIGFMIALFHWLLFRRKESLDSISPIANAVIVLCIVTCFATLWMFKTIKIREQQVTQQYVIQHQSWWDQKKSLLPLYTKNRFGKEIGLINIQYFGSIESLKASLQKAGWEDQVDSFFYALLMRFVDPKSTPNTSFLVQLYLNKKPFLFLTAPSFSKDHITLRFWRSNFHIQESSQGIWVGSIQKQKGSSLQQSSGLITQLRQTLKQYKVKTIIISPQKTHFQSESWPTTMMLLIEEER